MKKRNFNTLVLHRIVKDNVVDFEDITEEILSKIIHKERDSFLTIEEAFSEKKSSLKSICLTFDDGYKSDIEIVLPRLIDYQVSATFFVVKDFLNKDGYMNERDVIELSRNGMQIGSHSVSHPNFLEIGDSMKIDELSSSRKYLEDLISKEISTFSFPFGFINKSSIDMVFDSGYKYCCISQHGLANSGSRIIPRNSINGSQKLSTIFNHMEPSVLTRAYWFFEDQIKTKLKRISPEHYTRLRNYVFKK